MATPTPTSLPSDPLPSSLNRDRLVSFSPWSPAFKPLTAQHTPSRRTTRSTRTSSAMQADNENELDETSQTPHITLNSNVRPEGLLDATPSLSKANLSTPLVPLGTPLRSALKPINVQSSTPFRSPSRRTPLSKVTFESPLETPSSKNLPTGGKTMPDSFETTNEPSPSSTTFGRVASRKTGHSRRQDPRGCSPSSSEGEADEPSESDREDDSPCKGPTTPLGLPSHLLPQTPSAYRFSPTTPTVRHHQSYSDDELTDCDADYSIYEEEASYSYPSRSTRTMAEVNEGDEQIDEQEVVQEDTSPVFGDEISSDDEAGLEVEEEAEVEEAGEKRQVEEIAEGPSGDSAGESDGMTGAGVAEVERETVQEEIGPDELAVEIVDDSEEEAIEDVASIESASTSGLQSGVSTEVSEPGASDEETSSETVVETPVVDTVLSQSPSEAKQISPSTPPKVVTVDSRVLSTPVAAPSLARQTPQPVGQAPRPPPTASTPARVAAPSIRPSQAQVTDAPTARRQLTKLTSLASKRSLETLKGSQTRPNLTSMVPGSTFGGRPMPTKLSTLATPSDRRPRPISSSTSRLAQPASRVRPAEKTTQQLSTVNESHPPASSSSAMRPPSSTIPRPRVLPKTGLRPPSAPSASSSSSLAQRPPSMAPTPSARTVPPPSSTRTLNSSIKPPRALTTPLPRPTPSTATSNPSSRHPLASSDGSGARPLTAPPTASRPLPALAQTASAPTILASSTRPIPTAPPIPRSARPAPPARPAPSTIPSQPLAVSSDAAPHSDTVLERSKNPLSSSYSREQPASPRSGNRLEPALVQLPPSPVKYSPPRNATHLSPPRHRTAPPSPFRSPRRIPIDPASQNFAPTLSSQLASALLLPADKLVAQTSSLGVFGAPPPDVKPQSLPVRSTRTRRTRPTEEEAPIATVTLPTKRITRRAAATSTTLPPAALPLPPPPIATGPLIPRSSRRPPKPSPAVVCTEESEESTPSSASSTTTAVDDVASSSTRAVPRPPATYHFNPAPSITQEELNRLTQRNSKKNQVQFNLIKIETVYLDHDRPPSPTSKIRKSIGSGGSGGRQTTKEGREARAAKRRNALRSSTDGSEFEALRGELGAGDDNDSTSSSSPKGPILHYRAPGDEEQYSSPARPLVKKGKKKSSTTVKVEKKSVRWDKALVYEGSKGDALVEVCNSIIKQLPLDKWGNSTDTSTNYAKPAPVVIRKRVFRDDEE